MLLNYLLEKCSWRYESEEKGVIVELMCHNSLCVRMSVDEDAQE